MKLIENYAERFHNYTIPSPEKCFELENGDELYIKRWITNGKINGKPVSYTHLTLPTKRIV